jgi:hypothetical protein
MEHGSGHACWLTRQKHVTLAPVRLEMVTVTAPAGRWHESTRPLQRQGCSPRPRYSKRSYPQVGGSVATRRTVGHPAPGLRAKRPPLDLSSLGYKASGVFICWTIETGPMPSVRLHGRRGRQSLTARVALADPTQVRGSFRRRWPKCARAWRGVC